MEINFKGSSFIGEIVRLRPPELTDLDAIMKFWNTYETRRYLNEFIPNSRLQEEKWIRDAMELADAKKEYHFMIESKSINEVLGSLGVFDLNWIDRNGIIGITINNPQNYNKGYGTDALRCLMKFCFNNLHLHRIQLSVFSFNPRAKHVYEKVGFKEIGRKREDKWFEGQYYDVILLDILETEFK